MLATTEIAIKAIMASDATITPDTQQKVLCVLLGQNPSSQNQQDEDDNKEIWTRETVARKISRTVRIVDLLGKRGVFKRVYFSEGKNRRAVGYSRQSVLQAIQNGISKTPVVNKHTQARRDRAASC